MSDFIPAYRIIAATDATPTKTAVMLHGILGSKQNWRSFLRGVVADRPSWQFITPDHRHHGDSKGASAPNTLAACADDVARLLASLSLEPDVVMGHSFGAKVALTFAQRHPTRQVWMLDALPTAVDATDDALARHDVVRVIRALHNIPLPLSDRTSVVAILGEMGFSESLGRWMTTNLEHDKASGGYVWRFNLAGVEELLADYLATDLWPFVHDLPRGLGLRVVRGGKSSIWTETALDQFGQVDGDVRLHTIADAGHWLHADRPEALKALLLTALS